MGRKNGRAEAGAAIFGRRREICCVSSRRSGVGGRESTREKREIWEGGHCRIAGCGHHLGLAALPQAAVSSAASKLDRNWLAPPRKERGQATGGLSKGWSRGQVRHGASQPDIQQVPVGRQVFVWMMILFYFTSCLCSKFHQQSSTRFGDSNYVKTRVQMAEYNLSVFSLRLESKKTEWDQGDRFCPAMTLSLESGALDPMVASPPPGSGLNEKGPPFFSSRRAAI